MIERLAWAWFGGKSVRPDQAVLAMVLAFAAVIAGAALALTGDGVSRFVWAVFALVMLAYGLASAHQLTRSRPH